MRRLKGQSSARHVKDDVLAKAVIKLMPIDPYEFKSTFQISELRIAAFSSHVPIFRITTSSPVIMSISRDDMMSSFNVGCFQSSFLSQPDMVYALVKTLNCQLQGIFENNFVKRDHSILKIKSMVNNLFREERRM